MAQIVHIENAKPFLADCVGCARRLFVGPGWRRLSLERIFGLVEPGHNPSIRVLEKVGMRFDKMVDYLGDRVAQYVVHAPEPPRG